MKHLVIIATGAVMIGLLLTLLVYYLMGSNPGYFFARFVAAPVGLVCALLLFLLYDHRYPKS